ncbi:MAG: AAA family ATPase [Fusobacteriaceae bacterium]
MNIFDLMSENEMKLDIMNYSIRIVGQSGIGKSPLYNYFCKYMQEESKNPDIAYLIPLEDRYDHLPNIKTIRPKDKHGNFKKKVETWAELTKIVDLLVKEKLSNPDFPIKRIAIDTTTKMEMLAQAEVIRLWFEKTGTIATFNATWGSYGAPVDKAVEISRNQVVDKLRSAGFIVDTLTQARIKSQTDPSTGADYQIVSTDSGEKYDARTFLQDSDISFFITRETSIAHAGTTKLGKVINVRKDSGKFLRLQSDGMYSGCKSPFYNCPDVIEADDFEVAVKQYCELFKKEMSAQGGIPLEDYDNQIQLQSIKRKEVELDNLAMIKEEEADVEKKEDILAFVGYWEKIKSTLAPADLKQVNDYFTQLMAKNGVKTLVEALVTMNQDELNNLFNQLQYKK